MAGFERVFARRLCYRSTCHQLQFSFILETTEYFRGRGIGVRNLKGKYNGDSMQTDTSTLCAGPLSGALGFRGGTGYRYRWAGQANAEPDFQPDQRSSPGQL